MTMAYVPKILGHTFTQLFAKWKKAQHRIYARFTSDDAVSPEHAHTRSERGICHCEMFRYFPHFHATFECAYACVLGHSTWIQFNTLTGQNISTTNTFHFIYLNFFPCLFCSGILFAWAHQCLFVHVICSLILIRNFALFTHTSNTVTDPNFEMVQHLFSVFQNLRQSPKIVDVTITRTTPFHFEMNHLVLILLFLQKSLNSKLLVSNYENFVVNRCGKVWLAYMCFFFFRSNHSFYA